MIKEKYGFFAIFFVVILAVNGISVAVDTADIDAVYEKAVVNSGVLTDDDIKVIDDFVASTIDELLVAEDDSEVARLRRLVSSRRGSSETKDYNTALVGAVKKNLTRAFDAVTQWYDAKAKLDVQRNLIVLAGELQDTELAEFALGLIGHEDTMVRYWAVKCIANEGVLETLNSGGQGTGEVTEKIVEALELTAEKETHGEILCLIAVFADQLEGPWARGLLLTVADARISAYEKWTVKYELMDTGLLRSLADRAMSSNSEEIKAAVARKFAQLYSYVMQRYMAGGDFLSDDSREYLAAVLVEVEASVLDKLLGRGQSAIKNAIEQKDMASLQSEHDSLLGTASRTGRLGYSLGFDYGDGLTAPKKLPSPPAKKTD